VTVSNVASSAVPAGTFSYYFSYYTFEGQTLVEGPLSAAKSVTVNAGQNNVKFTDLPPGPVGIQGKFIYIDEGSGIVKITFLQGNATAIFTDDGSIVPSGNPPPTHPRSITGTGTAPHADSRSILVDSKGRIFETDDGGLYRLNFSTGGAW